MRIFAGTSGWNYRHWQGIFYPKDLGQNKWLEYYAKFFNSVELNVTFYRSVGEKTFRDWYKRTPKKFYFAAKGPRFITHIKRLKITRPSLDLFIDSAVNLKEKLTVILWQLPPGFKKDLKRLETFLKLLKKTEVRQAFEFRNDTWFDADTYSLLEKYNACLCIAQSGRFPCIKEITADFIYLRFHGGGSLYSSDYSDKDLKEWATFARQFKDKDIFAFFNNDAQGHAIKNSLKFREFLEK